MILGYGNKGFIFTLDMTIAVFLVMTILFAATYYTSKVAEPLSRLQMIRTGYDIIAVLDYSGALASLDGNEIKGNLMKILPPNYEMRLAVNGTDSGSIIVETSEMPEGKRFVGTGKRFFVSENYYGVVKFYVWLK